MEKGTAYFVKYPKTLQDLLILHDVAEENPYEIVKDIRLQPIDYENFKGTPSHKISLVADQSTNDIDGRSSK